MNVLDFEQLTLFLEDFPASPSVWLESKKEKKMTVTYGLKCLELSENLRRVGSFVKTYLESSNLPPGQWSRIWSKQAITSSCSILKLRLSERRTEEAGSPLWATPNTMDHLPPRSEEALMKQATTSRKGRTRPANLREQVDEKTMRLWPTPRAQEWKDGVKKLPPSRAENPGRDNLTTRVCRMMMYATPQSRDFRTGQKERWEDPNRSRNLNDQIGGQLNPTWVEWLMGFPIGYTEVE